MNLGLDLGLLWPLWTPWGLALIGLCAGSFINVWVRRLPLMMARRWWWDTSWQLQSGDGLADATGSSAEPAQWRQRRLELAEHLQGRLQAQPVLNLSRPRSHCPACGHVLKWHENLPVLGWVRLRGRCSACGTVIGWRYPAVELGAAALFLCMGFALGFGPQALLWGAWASVLLAMSLVDWDTTLLPDEMTLPLLWCGLTAAALGWTLPLSDSLWGAVLGYGGLWCVVWAFEWVTGKEAMGGGDLKLLAALGAWLGPIALLPVLFIASFAGAAVGLGMKARGQLREGRFVPFGPFLAGAGWVVAMWGHGPLLNWVGL